MRSGGLIEMGDHDPDVIEVPEDGAESCCAAASPRSDCRIDLPYDRSKVVTAPPTERQARITVLEQVAEAVMRLKLALVDDAGDTASADFQSASSCG